MTMNFWQPAVCRFSIWSIRALLVSLLVLATRPTPVLAWGAEGHKVIALIALHELSPIAKRRIQELIGGDLSGSLEDASVWADRVRFYRRETGPWHYVDIEITNRAYDRLRDCPDDDCVVEQIGHDLRALENQSLDQESKTEALKFLIHFVGDIHQPLHCADNHDRGGNEIYIVAGRRHANLHEIWDADVVDALGRDAEVVAPTLIANITDIDRRAWSRGGPADWANESFALAKSEIYRRIGDPVAYSTVMLPSGYARSEDGVAAIQLERAGVRLAMLLNQVLGH
jgi:hypothetical protein